MSFDWINQYYKLDVKVGLEVEREGKRGVVVEDMGNYVGVIMDDRPNQVRPYHPTDLVYGGMAKRVPKISRSAMRYRDYINMREVSDITFKEYLRNEKEIKEWGTSRHQHVSRSQS